MLYRLRDPEPLHLTGRPTHCHWCTGMLRRLRIFTRAKTARGTIARRSVSEKEKNEPRGMPWPALASRQSCSRKGEMAARGRRKRNSSAPVSEADT
jgi:hypothetical protein